MNAEISGITNWDFYISPPPSLYLHTPAPSSLSLNNQLNKRKLLKYTQIKTEKERPLFSHCYLTSGLSITLNLGFLTAPPTYPVRIFRAGMAGPQSLQELGRPPGFSLKWCLHFHFPLPSALAVALLVKGAVEERERIGWCPACSLTSTSQIQSLPTEHPDQACGSTTSPIIYGSLSQPLFILPRWEL